MPIYKRRHITMLLQHGKRLAIAQKNFASAEKTLAERTAKEVAAAEAAKVAAAEAAAVKSQSAGKIFVM